MNAPRQWREGADMHLDLRGLSPPQPLVSILRLLHTLERDTDLVVYLDRDPVLLYAELEPLQRRACPEPGDAGGPGDPAEVRLRLSAWPAPPAAEGDSVDSA